MSPHLPEDDERLVDRLRELRRAAPGFLRRQGKTLYQVRYGWDHPRRVGFVFGCQRSGTKMLMRVLDRSPHARIFHENHASAFRAFQLRSPSTIERLIALNPAPVQVFKPICDSQRADELLDRFPEARALWIYRHPEDVANSAGAKWGAHQAEVVAAVVRGDLAPWGWRTARLPEAAITEVRRVAPGPISAAEGALLFWYLRNQFFFSLGLDRHPRVRLLRYEDLVTAPEEAFAPVLAHLGIPRTAGLFDLVRPSSIRRHPPPPAREEIRALCLDLLDRLDRALAAAPPAPPPLRSLLILNNTLGTGGAERYIVTVANWLVERGIAVTVGAREGELCAELDPRVRFVDIDLEYVRTTLPRAARRVRALIEETAPQAILANSLAASWVGRAAQGLRRVPIVNVAHGWPAERYRRVAPLMRVNDAVVAVSPEVQRKLVAGGLDASRCRVVFNGVDCRPFGPLRGEQRQAARGELGAGPDDLLVINVGRLSAQKAQHHMIELAARLRGRLPALRWAIVGPGEREEELRALARERGVDDILRLLLRRSDVPRLLGSADIYLSTSNWEGMPLSTIEAMASALPCVVTRTEGAGELLDEGSGVLVPVGDLQAMQQAISALAEDPAARRAMGEAARERALRLFSHERMARELLAVIEEVARP